MKKIVICGAGGFVGGNLVKYYRDCCGGSSIRAVSFSPVDKWLQKFDDVENISCDLREPMHALAVTKDANVVYNLAAKVGGIHMILDGGHKSDYYLTSLINLNLLMACTHWKVSRYFYASSACVYPDRPLDCRPFKESDAQVLDPRNAYATAKLFDEGAALAFAKDRGLPVTIARYHTIYGPGDDRKAAQGVDHAPAALVRKAIDVRMGNSPSVEVWGDGLQTRNFVYVDDIVEATFRLVLAGADGVYNVGSPELVTIRELVDIIEKIGQTKLPRVYNPDGTVGVCYRASDNTALKKAIHWEPKTTLATGMKKLYVSIYHQAAWTEQSR